MMTVVIRFGKLLPINNPGNPATVYKKKILIFIFMLSWNYIFSQQPTDSIANSTLKGVIISRYHVNDSLLNAPASIGLLTTKDIHRNNLSDITPVLNTIPGVYMQSGGINT